MRLHSDMEINGKHYSKGSYVSWTNIYPFFLIHMAMFGGSGFFIAYGTDAPSIFLYAHGGFAVFVYLIFYLAIFGKEDVKWMFINAGLGLFGIFSEISLMLGYFGKDVFDFHWSRHVIPFFYYVLYMFLLRQMLLDIFNAREDELRKRRIEKYYISISSGVYLILFVLSLVNR